MAGRRARHLFAVVAFAAPLAAQEPTTPLDSSAGRIIFSVIESFADSAGHTHLVLRAGAERRLQCWSHLGFRGSTHGDTVTVDGWFTTWSGGCISDEVVPPMGSIPLPMEPARRVLEIVRLGAVDRYRLSVTSDAIQVSPIDTARASVLRDSTPLWRFPRNSLAIGCRADANAAHACAEVGRLLAGEPGLVPIELPAAGRSPYSELLRGAHVEPVRCFRVRTRASYDRLLRDLQRLHAAYAERRTHFNVIILRWTGAWWSTDRPEGGQVR